MPDKPTSSPFFSYPKTVQKVSKVGKILPECAGRHFLTGMHIPQATVPSECAHSYDKVYAMESAIAATPAIRVIMLKTQTILTSLQPLISK